MDSLRRRPAVVVAALPVLALALLATALVWGQKKGAAGLSPGSPVITKEIQEALTPAQILQGLKDGNDRFLAGKPAQHDFKAEIKLTASGQHPAGIVLACIDSRVLPEIIFDNDIGDIFDARVAGNVVDKDIAGSMEYACGKAGSKLVLVMGHTNCGAVKGAIDGVELGNLTGLLAKIKPAIDSVKNVPGERSSKNQMFVDAVARANVELMMGRIREISPVLKKLEEEKKIQIVGAIYDVRTGKVEFFR